MIPLSDVEAVAAAHPGVAVHVYEGADHRLNCDARACYHPASVKLAHQYKNWRPHPEGDVWVQPNGTGPITLDSIDVDFPAVANECGAVDADPSLYVNLLCSGELSHLEAVRDSDTCTPP